MAIARLLERYLAHSPRAADTAEGIRSWWVGGQRKAASLEDVQAALDHLVEAKRVSRVVLADGTIIYARAATSDEG
jgi:hypothetical protein